MSICGSPEAIADVSPELPGGVLVGRRQVLDANLEVVGYRPGIAAPGCSGPSAVMTPELASRAVATDLLGPVFSGRPGFVKPSPALLTSDEPLPDMPEGSVVEVDAAHSGDDRVLQGCRRLVDSGVALAVHNPLRGMADDDLVTLASYVAIDVEAVPFFELGPWVEAASQLGKKPMALGVDSPDQLASARAAGFELYEGLVLLRPLSVVAEAFTPGRLTCLRLLEKVNDPDTSASDLEQVVATDPGLSYRLLHVSGLGAAGGLRRPVRSIREATVLLGRDFIHRFLVLMLMADANGGAPEQLTIAMTRARMCELIAGDVCPGEVDAAFTVGLVSALDLLLGASLPEVVAKLAITDEIKAALLEGEGRLGGVLADVADWERGRPSPILRSGIEACRAERHYLDALAWSERIQSGLTDS